MIRQTLLALSMAMLSMGASKGEDQRPDVETVLSKLPVETKVKLLTGIGFSLGPPLPGTDQYIPGVAGYTWSMPEHGLPSMLLADGPAGLRFAASEPGGEVARVATAFPIATVVASTWDPSLADEMGQAMGVEARTYGVDIILAPGLNLQRNPLGGRNYEYYSEDPLLSGRMAAAAVRGIQSTGTGATIKHFVANNQETNRPVLDTLVDERTLRELYLRGFEIAVKESQPAAVMTAYNLLNGTHTSEDRRINTEILRNEWGFDGIVMTDWFAGTDPAAQILAGHNLLMPGTDKDRESISEALASGRMTEADLDKALRPTLQAILRADQLDAAEADLRDHAAIARRIAADGTVLLKNEGVLPLDSEGTKLALFGVGAFDTVSGGTGSGDVAEAYLVSIADGLAAAGFGVDQAIQDKTTAHIEAFNRNLPPRNSIFDPVPRVGELALGADDITGAAERNDVAIVTISRIAGEFTDRSLEADFLLTDTETALIERVSTAFDDLSKPVIVVLNVAGPIETASWSSAVQAILVPWMGGQESGHGVADLVGGRVAPSGHLPMTWPLDYSAVSTAASFPGKTISDEAVMTYAGLGTGFSSLVQYDEGLFVGYRSGGENAAFPFGYGLSYTEFDLAKENVRVRGDTLNVSFRIRNTGAVPARDVVQVYTSSPMNDEKTPPLQLRGFTKTTVLEPGSKQGADIAIPLRDLAHFDVEKQLWVVPAGKHDVFIGRSLKDLPLRTSFTLRRPRTYAP